MEINVTKHIISNLDTFESENEKVEYSNDNPPEILTCDLFLDQDEQGVLIEVNNISYYLDFKIEATGYQIKDSVSICSVDEIEVFLWTLGAEPVPCEYNVKEIENALKQK